MPKARIKLYSTELTKLNTVCSQITDIADKLKVKYSGPINLPTKFLKVATRRSPDGEGSETYERWEMRIHKRMVDIAADERALHMVMRVPIPPDVNIEIQVIE
ncbi:30S ribosomal protein S10 [Candidatus Woesearchaeota archaeon]|jgi:small subunit ribosomal protein S10|nr:30S ribosomal protein S10 [Candidatus Woesearchaeota archaeon]MBT4114478.1 30S ribosomal protein S10 [Candidatus Woesearchaeota archaeon]MBT4248650.1 30S ribosomal protein S10 [Candidatus Woesearchaeota archaeon]